MNKVNSFFFSFFISSFFSAFFVIGMAELKTLEASEIDSFTLRHLPLSDSLDWLNDKMQTMLEETAAKANQKDQKAIKVCDENNLYTTLDQVIGGRPRGKIEIFIEESEAFEKHSLKLKDSLYSEFSFFEAPALYLSSLGSMIRLNGLYIGTDKFGHFAAQGWIYFNEKHRKNKGTEGALKWGENSEAGAIGKAATGIYSHGDLAANYQGLIFFERVLGNKENAEDLAKNFPPYFRCEDRQWKVQLNFDWTEYIDASWDEGYNCNEYRNEKVQAKVLKKFTELSRQREAVVGCPLVKGPCAEAFAKYPEAIARRIFSPLCQTPAL